MRCVICDSTDKWENVDQFRLAAKGMAICGGCGFVSYPTKYKSEDEIKAYYKSNYRAAPNVNNLFTGQKKLHIHAAFLGDLFGQWEKSDLKAPVVCDVGAAYGQFLNWVKRNFPEADLNGTEYALSYRRNAFHEFGLKLDVDFDKAKKYHLISSFKVAEHQLDVDLRLREYAEALREDGFLYISVPIWFDKMTNFGLDGFDLEYYYEPAHINVWTINNFKSLLSKCGLEIVKEDHLMYDSTFLCKRNDSLMSQPRKYEDPDLVKKAMGLIKDAALLYLNGKFDEALKKFPRYPSAWLALYEANRAKAHAQKQGEPPFEYIVNTFLNPALKACGESLEIVRLVIDVHMRYERYKEAANWCQKGLQIRPNNSAFLMALQHCLREIALRCVDHSEKLRMFTEARDCTRYLRDIDLQMRNECVNWIYRDNSEIPTPFESSQ